MYIDQYTDEVKKHFLNPHNMGKIAKEDLKAGEALATGTVGNPKCGDLLTVYLRIKDNTIKEIKVETFGCASAIACSSVTSDLAKGRTLTEAKAITKKTAADALGGLPPIKMHCSNLAAEALHKAISNYEQGVETVTKEPVKKKAPTQKPAVKKTKAKVAAITGDMTLGEVVTEYPQTGQIMMQYGLHCIGCHVATWETVEQGAAAHGLPAEQINKMIEDMNKSIV
ncbi:hypothetical protein AUK40_02050 [Candidatus Wirthbacteria bacterium CG2_30_54_11]|uniref:Iron-sulfur cluster assembly scaffold protein n=1 Tax=Candidatus Wirthbacteria bacterium CG2_30_54_11 TaxID=1817892 RepID=A0A1J5ILM2_9BACT|nr:MAG: hypothetical protein AUK40_02050 [Candidatus Wirthbacteria bacterium CG2_30_54_11]